MSNDKNQINSYNTLDDDKKDEEELQKTDPEYADSLGMEGSEPDPEEVEGLDTLEQVQKMGLYKAGDEEHPQELGVVEEIEKDEQAQWEG